MAQNLPPLEKTNCRVVGGRSMGFGTHGLDSDTCFKTKNRWLFSIEGLTDENSPISCLPPLKSAKPSLSFKEIEAQHITETVYFPGKPEWKPVNLTFYDIKKDRNPIFDWIEALYGVYDGQGKYYTSCDKFKVPSANLKLYNGVGDLIELWTFE